MSDNPDLDARLARLAARKAAAGGAKPAQAPEHTATVMSIHAAASDDMTPTPASTAAPAKKTKRRHPAAAGRILSVGLSSSAFLSLISAFGSQPSGASAASSLKTPATRPAAPPKIVIKDVHHTIYVDQFGRRIPAPSVPKGLTAVPGAKQPAAGAGPKQSGSGATYGGSPSGGSSSGGAPAWPSSPSGGATYPPPAGGGGSSSGPGSPSNPAPAPSPSQPAPGPTPTTPHVTPGPTSPPVTSAPVTVVTTPPPPPPPPCTGSKCP